MGSEPGETLICIRIGIAVDQASQTRYPLLRPDWVKISARCRVTA
jgi:hypothetical protein